ncbi:MAG TPA: hypothetical protein VF071_00740 [Candidatus Limnocylindria bacterium]
MSGRTPHLPFAVLLGALLIVGVTLRVLNAEPAATNEPLSGARVEGPVVGEAPAVPLQLPDEPGAWLHAVTERPGEVLAGSADGDPVPLGPPAFPAETTVALTVALPTAEETAVVVSTARLKANGNLAGAADIELAVAPGADGRATIQTGVDALLGERAPGIFRVQVAWDGTVIATQDVALGMDQPSAVAIFDEPRQVVFLAGEYTGVRFNAGGAIIEEHSFRLGADSGAPGAAYARFQGTPHVLIAKGLWAGFWMPLGEGIELR